MGGAGVSNDCCIMIISMCPCLCHNVALYWMYLECWSTPFLFRKISIDSRFFVTSGKMILDAKWHPGSQADVNLMVLTSDNNLR